MTSAGGPIAWRAMVARLSTLGLERLGDMNRAPRWWLKNAGVAGYTNHGMIAAPTVNTSTAVASGDTSTRCFNTLDTAATNGSVCGVVTAAFTYVRRCFKPGLAWPIRTQSSVTAIRIWDGYFSASLSGTDTPTTQHVAAFHYSEPFHGTAFWRCVTCDGASNVTTTVTTVPAATATEYQRRVEMDGAAGNVSFFINDVLVAVHKTNLPGNTTNLGFGAEATTLENVAKGLRVGTFELRHL